MDVWGSLKGGSSIAPMEAPSLSSNAESSSASSSSSNEVESFEVARSCRKPAITSGKLSVVTGESGSPIVDSPLVGLDSPVRAPGTSCQIPRPATRSKARPRNTFRPSKSDSMRGTSAAGHNCCTESPNVRTPFRPAPLIAATRKSSFGAHLGVRRHATSEPPRPQPIFLARLTPLTDS